MLEVVPNRIYKLVRIVPHDIISKNIVFLSLKIDIPLTNSADSNIMRHFIWVFTVFQSTDLSVSDPQKVKLVHST